MDRLASVWQQLFSAERGLTGDSLQPRMTIIIKPEPKSNYSFHSIDLSIPFNLMSLACLFWAIWPAVTIF